MSDDTPETSAPVLRREALLPNERSRGLGTVAVVCTMAGVASGLALATTLMAMQVADTMSARTCPYRTIDVTTAVEPGVSLPHERRTAWYGVSAASVRGAACRGSSPSGSGTR